MDKEILNQLKALQEHLQSTSSTLEKRKMLKELTNNNQKLKDLIITIYNPHKKFGVTAKRIQNFKKEVIDGMSYSIFELLEALANKSLTGHKAIMAVLQYIQENRISKELVLDIISKDLKIHMSKKEIMNTFGCEDSKGLNFSVALAQSYDEKTKHIVDKNWFISRKLDGVRCITIIDDQGIRFFSRQGKEFLTLNNVKKELERLNFKNIVLDGEIALVQDDTENFQGVMKEIRKKNHTMRNPKYFIFDTLTLEEFKTGESERTFKERMRSRPDVDGNILTYLEQVPYSKKAFEDHQKKVQDQGWEGLILRKNAPYKGKRSKDILKVKNFKDDEFRVTGIETGLVEQHNGKVYKKVEGLTAVKILYKGNEVRVGSGFSAPERIDFMKHPEKIVGKLIRVRYFEESTNQENEELSLRFPTFKGIIGDVRDT